MASIEDDAYSFGFILLEALVGPSLAATREVFLLKEMVYLIFWSMCIYSLFRCHFVMAQIGS